MKNTILNYIKSRDGILIIIGAVILITIGLSIAYIWPREIDIKYSGIRYQAGTKQGAEPVLIEIKGYYSRGLFRKGDKFYGSLKLGDEIFTDWPISFDRNNSGWIDREEGTYGSLFISDKFKTLTIEVYEQGEKGGLSWNSGDGWLVSAPCRDREEALIIANNLIQKRLDSIEIK